MFNLHLSIFFYLSEQCTIKKLDGWDEIGDKFDWRRFALIIKTCNGRFLEDELSILMSC
jgi:hypothetical protein